MGIADSERKTYLQRMADGENSKTLKNEIEKKRKMSMIRSSFQTMTGSLTWEDCAAKFPIHTSDEELEIFTCKGMHSFILSF